MYIYIYIYIYIHTYTYIYIYIHIYIYIYIQLPAACPLPCPSSLFPFYLPTILYIFISNQQKIDEQKPGKSVKIGPQNLQKSWFWGLLGVSWGLLWPLGELLGPSWPTLAPRANITSKKLVRGPLWDPHLGAILEPKLTNLAQNELTRCLLEVKLAQVGPKLLQVGSI